MRSTRSGFLIILAVTLTEIASAQGQYPTRPVRIILPTSQGTGSDLVARLIAQPLAERLGQQFVVDNRPGAATMIGAEAVAKSAPDGHTLLMTPLAFAINHSIYKKVPYDALRDFAPISHLINQPSVFVVHPSFPAKSVKELIAVAKARPGEIAFASSGAGTNAHLFMELFLFTTGARMLHVPYKGPAPAIIDLMSGRVSVMIAPAASAFPQIRAGRLRALGVTSAKRVAAMPDLPTIAEAGVPGYEATVWNGLFAPAGTSKEIIARLHREVTAVLNLPGIRERLAQEGSEVVASSPDELAAHLRAEMIRWAKVVKSAGIQPE